MTISSAAGRLLIALVVVNAATGISALILSSDKQIGSLEGHIFLTTLAVSMSAFSILPCLLAYERRGSTILAGLGVGAALLTLGILTVLIWEDDPSDDLGRLALAASAVSLGLALVNLLSLAVLPRANEWLRLAAYALTAVLVAQILVMCWRDETTDGGLRLFAATAILLAAASVLVPILQRMGGSRPEPQAPSLRYCPSCGTALNGNARPAGCPACGARFSVTFE